MSGGSSTKKNSLMNLPEISRIFEDIKSKSDDGKEKASLDLRSIYSKYTEQSEEVKLRLSSLIQTNYPLDIYKTSEIHQQCRPQRENG